MIPFENDWSGEELNLANHQLISVLNSSALAYHEVQTAADQGGENQIVKEYENVRNSFIRQISCLFQSISISH